MAKAKAKETIERYERFVIASYNRLPIVIARGAGSRVWDVGGKEYIDLFPGWAVSGLGHCHPKVVEAIRAQAGELLHFPNNFYMPDQGRLAEMLSTRSFGGRCFFCNSGAEACEAAIKLARLHSGPGRYKIITMENSFHGRTFGAMSATGQPKYHKGFEPLLGGFSYVPFNDLAAVEKAADAETCAVMLEPVQGEGGINVAAKEFLRGLRRLCDERGLLLILDEIQTGMGRTGKLFAYQYYGMEPDVMCLAKTLGGGVAIGAMVARADVSKAMKPGTHASTFGGNPLACAAAIATLEAIETEGLVENARRMGDLAAARLREIFRGRDFLKEIRHLGLMIGVELAVPGARIVEEALAEGLIINCTHEKVLRLLPAMNIDEATLQEGLAILERVIGRVGEKSHA